MFSHIIESWANCYGNHPLVSVTIRFLHLTGIVLGGGAGILTDWQIIKSALKGNVDREYLLKQLNRAHYYVAPWMFVLSLTGALMTAADAQTFFVSKVYWTKIALILLLVVNGVALLLLESHARNPGIQSVWKKLTIVSVISAVLWQTILFVGVLLTVSA
jgi:hypothetical protein